LQKRPEWKTIQPGKWDTAVGGHVDFGEEIHTAMLREAREELGVDANQAQLIEKYVFTSECEKELIFAYKLTTDAEISPSAETDGGRFWSMEDIHDAIGQGTLTPNFEQEFMRLFEKK
jgi:8-oxo-dGTP pyrophosphatase MutT (NUDIX family)